MEEENLQKIMQAVGNVKLTSEEKEYMKWLSNWDYDTVDNIVSVMNKMKNRGAGRKKEIKEDQIAMIQMLRAQGKTYKKIAEELEISYGNVYKYCQL